MDEKIRFKEARKLMEDNLKSTASRVGIFVESEAKYRTPVDTGHLRRSLTHNARSNKRKTTVFVGTNVKYAPEVELGIGQPAQPYIAPAINENTSVIQSLIHEGLTV